MKKKIFAALIAATMVASSLVGCGSQGASTGSSAEMKVAMVTDYGDITDQSFNQSTYEACKAFGDANKVDFTYYKPEGDSDAERVAMIDKAVADGFNVIWNYFGWANQALSVFTLWAITVYLAHKHSHSTSR
jgi:basic membrane protein A